MSCVCIYQCLRTDRIWHKINFYAKFNRFELRVFLLFDWLLKSEKKNHWIYTFPKSIVTLWNANILVKGLNSGRSVHFQRRLTLHHGHFILIALGMTLNCIWWRDSSPRVWGLWGIPSFPLLSGSLWPGVVVSFRVPSMSLIQLFNHLLSIIIYPLRVFHISFSW